MSGRKEFLKGVAALTVLCVCVSLCGAEPLVLAERGTAAAYSIVIPAKALPAQRYVAEELRDFTEKVTGVRPPIVTDAAALPAKAIVLEVGSGTKGTDGTKGMDGFRLKVEAVRA